MSGDETVKALEDHYGKLLAIAMHKHNLRHLQIGVDDIQKADAANMALAVQELDGVLHIRLVTMAEAIKLQTMERKFNPPKK